MNVKEEFSEVLDFLGRNPVLYAATLGLDKMPQVRPVRLAFAQEDALYFAAAKCERYYGELSMFPHLTLCAYDAERDVTLTLRGNAVFTEEEAIISRCLTESESLRKAWEGQPEMVTAYFLKDLTAELADASGEVRVIELGSPENALIGITWEKDKELRDRLGKILAAREAETPALGSDEEIALQKLYDGALMYFAETAKEVWPRMDIRPIERSAWFETYDEREKYTALAKKKIGNTVIRTPEDLTYWLNKETLAGLS